MIPHPRDVEWMVGRGWDARLLEEMTAEDFRFRLQVAVEAAEAEAEAMKKAGR